MSYVATRIGRSAWGFQEPGAVHFTPAAVPSTAAAAAAAIIRINPAVIGLIGRTSCQKESLPSISPRQRDRGGEPAAVSPAPVPLPQGQAGRLSLEGVRDLHKELVSGLRVMVVLGERPAVVVAQEHYRLPVELVGEEGRAREFGVLPGNREGVERGIAPRLHQLPDQAEE